MKESKVYTINMFKAANNVQWRDNWIICNECNEWLTQPIFLHSDNNHYCQSCSSKKENGYSDDVLESLLQKCIYPCRHINCTAWLSFYDIQEHEQSCNFDLHCLFCNDICVLQNVYSDHLLSRHAENCKAINIPTPKLQLTLLPNTTKIIIAVHKFNTFIVYIKNTSDGFGCCVSKYPFIKNDITNEFNLKFTSAQSNLIYIFKGQCIDPYLFRRDSSFTMITNKLQEESEISLTFLETDSVTKITECPICFHPMTGTIVSCGNGHPVCEDCGAKILRCAVCRTTMNGAKLKLSSIISNIQLPCQYADMGCLKVEAANKIALHSETCGYRPIDCWECNEEIPKNIISEHFNGQHKYLSKYIEVIDFNCLPISTGTWYSKCNEQIFRLTCKAIPDNNFSFAVHSMNGEDDENIEDKYEYRIILFTYGFKQVSNVILPGKCQNRTQDKITSVLTDKQYDDIIEQQFKRFFWCVYPIGNNN